MSTPLTTAELGIMHLLWQETAMTARQILERLYPTGRTSQHGTVQKLLQRLEDKGFVSRNQTTPVQQFSALITRNAYLGGELESLAEQVTGGSLAPLVTALLDEKKLTREDIAELRRIVEDI